MPASRRCSTRSPGRDVAICRRRARHDARRDRGAARPRRPARRCSSTRPGCARPTIRSSGGRRAGPRRVPTRPTSCSGSARRRRRSRSADAATSRQRAVLGRGPRPISAAARRRRELAVSAATGEGIDALLERCGLAPSASPMAGDGDALRHPRAPPAGARRTAARSRRAGSRPSPGSAELAAEDLRLACGALGRLIGRVDVEDVLDRLFASSASASEFHVKHRRVRTSIHVEHRPRRAMRSMTDDLTSSWSAAAMPACEAAAAAARLGARRRSSPTRSRRSARCPATRRSAGSARAISCARSMRSTA